MISGTLGWLSAPITLFIGMVGAVSIIKAVYIDRRELKCACVGGDNNVLLGFISLTKNLIMVGKAIWMAIKKNQPARQSLFIVAMVIDRDASRWLERLVFG